MINKRGRLQGNPRFGNPKAIPHMRPGETYEQSLNRETFKDHYNPDDSPHSDLQLSETVQSPFIDVRRMGQFTQVWDFQIREFSRGQILVTSQAVRTSFIEAFQFAAVNVRIVGKLGSTESILYQGISAATLRAGGVTGELGTTGQIRYGWDIDNIWERIALHAVQIIDGDESGADFSEIRSLGVSAVGRLWRI